MELKTATEILSRERHDRRPMKLVVVLHRPGSMGGTPCIEVEGIHDGFDWDAGKVMIHTAQPLTLLSPEDVTAIHESVKKGQSWHAFEAHRKIDDKRLAAERERDSYKLDAERHRFGREVMTNTKLQEAVGQLLVDWSAATPDPTTAEEHDAQADHMIAVATTAGLWPLKAEGDAA